VNLQIRVGDSKYDILTPHPH